MLQKHLTGLWCDVWDRDIIKMLGLKTEVGENTEFMEEDWWLGMCLGNLGFMEPLSQQFETLGDYILKFNQSIENKNTFEDFPQILK